MKPIYLEIEGVNSFREKQCIDLETLERNGIFGIFGPTGSGKSTILDAIMLALYGRMERAARNFGFINVNGTAASVGLTFEVPAGEGRERYEVRRGYKRKKNAREVECTAELYQLNGEDRALLAAGVAQVNERMKEIIGLSYKDFKRCVALPQGEFSSFIKEPHHEKVNIIGRIFSLEKYGEGLSAKISGRANEYDKELYGCEVEMKALGDVSREAISAKVNRLAEYRQEYKELQSGYKGLEDAVKTSEELFKNIQQLQKVNAGLEQYEASGESVQVSEESLKKAKRAKEVLPKLKQMLEMEKEVAVKRANLAKLSEELRQKYEYEKQELAGFENMKQRFYAEVLALTAHKDKLELLKPDVARLSELGAEREKLVAKHAALEAQLAQRTAERDSLNDLLDKSEEYVEMLSEEVAGVSISKEAVKALSLARDIEVEKHVLEDRLQETDELIEELNREREALSARVRAIEGENADLKDRLARADGKIREVFSSDCSRYEALCLLANENVARHSAVDTVKIINRNIQSLKDINAGYTEKMKNYAESSLKAIEIKNAAANDVAFLEDKLAGKLYEREEYLGKNIFALVTNELQVGSKCPLCENEIVKVTKDDRTSLEPFDEEIKLIKEQLKTATAKHEEADGVRSELEARADELERQIEVNRQEIERLREEAERVLSPYVDISPSDEERMESVLRLSDERVAKLEQLVNASNQLERDIADKEAAETKLSVQLEDLIRQADAVSAQREALSERLAELQLQYLKYEEVLKGISARSISDIILDNDGKKAKTIVKLTEQKELKASCTIHVKELEAEINELRIQINSLADDGKAFERERAELTNRLNAVVPEGSTIEDEQRKCQERINEVLRREQEYKIKYDEVDRLIKMLENSITEQKAMYKIKLQSLNALKAEGLKLIQKHGFKSVEEIKTCYLNDEAIRELEEGIAKFKEQHADLLKEQEQLQAKTAGFNLTEEELRTVKENLKSSARRQQELERETLLLENEIETMRAKSKQQGEIRQRMAEVKKKQGVLNTLKSLTKNNALMEFIAVDYIQSITSSASDTLLKLTNGRYYLEYENDFIIVDNISGGIKRGVSSLSGGETFLVSLSLAMALSDAVMNMSKKPIEFFFLDEGFGTLDKELMDTVVDSLDKFKDSDVSIGIISHVPELQEKIETKLVLTPATEKNGSHVRLVG